MLCVHTDVYEWTKKEKKLTDGTGIDAQGHGHADGCVGMWTWMRCGWMQMVDMLACGRVACGCG